MLHNRRGATAMLAIGLVFVLSACEGDDGSTGPTGPTGPAGGDGADGADGASALVSQTTLAAGSASCPNGGVRIDSGTDLDGDNVLDADEITDTSYVCNNPTARVFNRISSFLVCSQIDAACNDATETVAEIVAASTDGRTLIYTDGQTDSIGFADISDPVNPDGIGVLDVGGESTSVAVAGDLALVGVNTSPDFDNPSGNLVVVDIATQTVEATIDVGGQPDSIAVSPDENYLAIVIENERDEDENDGDIANFPQAPAGFLWVIDISGPVGGWAPVAVDLAGLAAVAAGDPEPEYVDINDENVAVVTLQENNHIVLVDLTTATVVDDFTAGTVNLTQIDATEEDPAIISQTEMQMAVPREPDGVAWITNELFATADEGDYLGGSRGFTIFNTSGDVVYTSGNSLDHLAVRYGHYPDSRSGNKGNEPENAEFGDYAGDKILVIASERSSLLFVYDVSDPVNPVLKQTLPAALGPEGMLAVTSRNLLVAASEEDNRGDKFRAALNIYRYELADPSYPTIASADRMDGTPIPWSAMSGLAADPAAPGMLYAIEDSYYGSNRIFGIDITKVPAELTTEITIKDTNDVFAAVPTDDVGDDNEVFSSADLAAMINADKTVNIDPEGIAVASAGGFWIASEGAGTVSNAVARPVEKLNFIFKTTADGVIETVVTLPDALNAAQFRFGFEGIAEYNGSGYVAFQRVWPDADGGGDPGARIGAYDLTANTWSFFFYPLEAPTSQNGGWVGLSDLTSLGDGRFLVVERDNQGGPDAAIKRLYTFDINGAVAGDTLTKTLVRDLIVEGDLTATGGLIAEKIEGSVVTADGDVYIINDNDGVDDNSGETNLINLGNIL